MSVSCTGKLVNFEVQPYFQIEKNELDFNFTKIIWLSLYYVAKLEANRVRKLSKVVDFILF